MNTNEKLIFNYFKNQAQNERFATYASCIYSIKRSLNNELSIFEIEKALKALIRKKLFRVHTRKSKFKSRTFGLRPKIYDDFRKDYKRD